jgi:hypothetical protein
MAAIEQTTSSAARPARMSAKVDFTAMVDLGFLQMLDLSEVIIAAL